MKSISLIVCLSLFAFIAFGQKRPNVILILADAPIQLFDLTTDPKESKDISAAHPEIVKKINRIMKEEHVQVEAFPFLK